MSCFICNKPSTRPCCVNVSYCSVECMQSHWSAGHARALCHVSDSMWQGPKPDYISIFMKTSEWTKLLSEALLAKTHIRYNVVIMPLTKTHESLPSWHPEPQQYVYIHVVNHDRTEILASRSIELK